MRPGFRVHIRGDGTRRTLKWAASSESMNEWMSEHVEEVGRSGAWVVQGDANDAESVVPESV